ncbi:MAG TPA: glycosyltransferase [Thermodesulfovibrionales bacterium]|nr:glycosyltransferase [Thermodesulfovibrionales bacterium]
MEKINILHIYQNSKIGGVQQQLLSLLKAYSRERFNPIFCCLGPKEEIGKEIEETKIEFIPLNKLRYNRFSLGIVLELYRLMKKKQIHVVRTHRYRSNLYGRLAAFLAGVPVIIASVHDNYRTDKRPKRRIMNRILSKITDKIVAVSEDVKEDIIRYDSINPSKIDVIPNGIDVERFNPEKNTTDIRKEFSLEDDDIVIGFIGRIVPAKGLKYLLNALPYLKKEFKSIKLLIVGEGSLVEELKERAKKNNIFDNILFTGRRRDIPEILASINIFVMPSIAEGLPNALLEAMAMGKPIVTTEVGGIPEIVKNGFNGLLVPPRDTLSLSKAIKELISNDRLAAKLGQAARDLVHDNLSIKAIAQKWQSLYLSILKEKA